MSPQLAAALAIIAICGFVYELAQVAMGKATITEQVRAFALRWPPILFLAGLLAGHLFAC